MMTTGQLAPGAARVSTRLVEVWAAGPDGSGRCGSGWIVGQRGVLTCGHVIEPYLACRGQAPGALQIRTVTGTSAADWVDCRVVWPGRASVPLDLVLLEIAPADGQTWITPAEPPSRLAAIGQRPVA